MSVATNKQLRSCLRKCKANLAVAVVLPVPCKPAIKTTVVLPVTSARGTFSSPITCTNSS